MVGPFELPFLRGSRTVSGNYHLTTRALEDTEPLPMSQTPDLHEKPVNSPVGLTPEAPLRHTSSHFFSLPLWKKRPATPSHGEGIDNFGRRPSVALIGLSDKELPSESSAGPLPKASGRVFEDADSPHTNIKVVFPGQNQQREGRPSNSRKSSWANLSASTSQPALALAQASLGLGLTQLTPHQASASSSTSNLSSIAVPIENQLQLRHSTSGVRRVKSFYPPEQANASVHSEEQFRVPFKEDSQRSRGLSLGFGRNTSDAKGKSVEGSHADEILPAENVKDLKRKSSFWSRNKKSGMMNEATSNPSVRPGQLPPLPSLRPLSPLGNEGVQDAEFFRRRSLQRRHSDRTSFRPLPVPADDISSPVVRRQSRLVRPSTADPTTPVSPQLTQGYRPYVDTQTTVLQNRSVEVNEEPPSRKPRPRSQTNPSFLPRLSLGFFSPSPQSQLPARTDPDFISPTPISNEASPRSSSSKRHLETPKPRLHEETPEDFILRLTQSVNKADVVGVLASNADTFYVEALQLYIDRFDFTENPLDVALRRLLMHVGLPRETQQIDRVMEAFASTYHRCNPDLFSTEDEPYILAFSLIMLHTDVFNKSNKRKMTKADYIKNTRLPGVAAEVLDYFFDNILFSPFIFIEDPMDTNTQRDSTESLTPRVPPTGNQPNSTLLGKPAKIDPYFLIAHDLLGPLRFDVKTIIPPESPYSYRGTLQALDESKLQRAFAQANIIEICGKEAQYVTALPMFSMNVGGAPGPMISNLGSFPGILPSYEEASAKNWALKVTKVGLLSRKEDSTEGGKRSTSRKWKEWSVILTGSQLLFFRDLNWATKLLSQTNGMKGQVLVPHERLIKPDELLSVKNAVALYDQGYTKYPNTLRFTMANGRQFLLQAATEDDLNEWISLINYASAFRSNSLSMRPLALSGKDVELSGVAAAAALLQEMRNSSGPFEGRSSAWDGDVPDEFVEMLFSNPDSGKTFDAPSKRHRKTLNGAPALMDLESPSPIVDGAQQFRATFDKVKAELTAGRRMSLDERTLSNQRESIYSSHSPVSSTTSGSPTDTRRSPAPSRAHVIRRRIRDLDAKISVVRNEIDVEQRLIRNLGVLTPFQRSTKDMIELAAQTRAKKITRDRMELARLVCHREILRNDMLAERKDFQSSTALALKAAEATLDGQRTPNELPPLLFSNMLEGAAVLSPSSPASSSFHSAVESLSDHDVAADLVSDSLVVLPLSPTLAIPSSREPHNNNSAFLHKPPVRESAAHDNPSGDSAETPKRRRSEDIFEPAVEADQVGAFNRRLDIDADEEAEDWHRTRAAKRVSLVKMPTDLRISTIFGRMTRTGGDLTTSHSVDSDKTQPTRRPGTAPTSPIMLTTLDF